MAESQLKPLLCISLQHFSLKVLLPKTLTWYCFLLVLNIPQSWITFEYTQGRSPLFESFTHMNRGNYFMPEYPYVAETPILDTLEEVGNKRKEETRLTHD